ncbi:hypothetical protein F4808DRAFT_423288 [Astrocystis sublimbata]|nr:hypothetical protein F4808DRAFT_423288 [Astrocystis sublimbata]
MSEEYPSIFTLQYLHAAIQNITSTRTPTSYAKALGLVEEITEMLAASGVQESESLAPVVRACEDYRDQFEEFIRRLGVEELEKEHMAYQRHLERKHGSNKDKRSGVLFEVDDGDFIVAALEALRLEQFLIEEATREEKKVRFS